MQTWRQPLWRLLTASILLWYLESSFPVKPLHKDTPEMGPYSGHHDRSQPHTIVLKTARISFNQDTFNLPLRSLLLAGI